MNTQASRPCLLTSLIKLLSSSTPTDTHEPPLGYTPLAASPSACACELPPDEAPGARRVLMAELTAKIALRARGCRGRHRPSKAKSARPAWPSSLPFPSHASPRPPSAAPLPPPAAPPLPRTSPWPVASAPPLAVAPFVSGSP